METDNNTNEIKPVTASIPNPKTTQPHKAVVETFAEDMAQVLGGDAGGMVKKIIHSEEERDAEKKNTSPEAKKNKIFILVGFLLLVFALVITLFLISLKKPNTVSIQPQFIPLIFVDKSTSLEISGLKSDEIKQAVFNEITNTTVNPQGVEGIYLNENKQMIGLRRFVSLINSHFVPNTNPLFVNDNFLMGVVKNQTDADPNSGTGFFILIKMRSLTDIFDSLRASEPNLLTDLHGFFGVNINSDTNYLFTKDFTDGIIDNKNARILYDQNGKIVLMYVYADDNSVVITDSQNAADQIILRLASSQVQQ